MDHSSFKRGLHKLRHIDNFFVTLLHSLSSLSISFSFFISFYMKKGLLVVKLEKIRKWLVFFDDAVYILKRFIEKLRSRSWNP